MIEDIQNPLQIARGISEIWHPLKWALAASFLLIRVEPGVKT